MPRVNETCDYKKYIKYKTKYLRKVRRQLHTYNGGVGGWVGGGVGDWVGGGVGGGVGDWVGGSGSIIPQQIKNLKTHILETLTTDPITENYHRVAFTNSIVKRLVEHEPKELVEPEPIEKDSNDTSSISNRPRISDLLKKKEGGADPPEQFRKYPIYNTKKYPPELELLYQTKIERFLTLVDNLQILTHINVLKPLKNSTPSHNLETNVSKDTTKLSKDTMRKFICNITKNKPKCTTVPELKPFLEKFETLGTLDSSIDYTKVQNFTSTKNDKFMKAYAQLFNIIKKEDVEELTPTQQNYTLHLLDAVNSICGIYVNTCYPFPTENDLYLPDITKNNDLKEAYIYLLQIYVYTTSKTCDADINYSTIYKKDYTSDYITATANRKKNEQADLVIANLNSMLSSASITDNFDSFEDKVKYITGYNKPQNKHNTAITVIIDTFIKTKNDLDAEAEKKLHTNDKEDFDKDKAVIKVFLSKFLFNTPDICYKYKR